MEQVTSKKTVIVKDLEIQADDTQKGFKIIQQKLEKPEGPIINISGLTKQYGQIKALDNIDIQVRRNAFICLVGPSGAGKSTLVKLLIREERPSSGKIIVAGRDIVRLKQKELPFYRRRIGVVFQDYKLLSHKTVWENIAFALEICDIPTREIAKRVPKILELVGLTDRAHNYPSELSGGEQQRVSIARALVHGPKVLIADEPTGNLDPQNTWEIIQLLQRINKRGTLVILATHDKSIVDRLHTRVVTLRAGKVISDKKLGTYEV